jgi:tetratricopeptide (TPR) repeat protein
MTRNKTILSLAAAALFSAVSITAQAQTLKVPAPSPTQTLKQNFALSEIGIEYSRPSAKGRVVFGDVVPFGKVWRTGANSSTKITFGEDVTVEGTPVKAGTYALYTIPNKDVWEIMFYKDLTLGGNVGDYKAADELFRFKVKPTALGNKVETFTINVADITSKSANIQLTWENTSVAFNVIANIDSAIMANIEKTVVKDNRPYYAAATYYYDNNKDMTQALAWANKAVEANPKAYWVINLKASIQLKMKDYKGAIATANQSLALAKEDGDDAYVKKNEKIIAEAQSASK